MGDPLTRQKNFLDTKQKALEYISIDLHVQRPSRIADLRSFHTESCIELKFFKLERHIRASPDIKYIFSFSSSSLLALVTLAHGLDSKYCS